MDQSKARFAGPTRPIKHIGTVGWAKKNLEGLSPFECSTLTLELTTGLFLNHT